MKVGIYIDGYNLYYGGRGICGRGEPGWRWLDLRRSNDQNLWMVLGGGGLKEAHLPEDDLKSSSV